MEIQPINTNHYLNNFQKRNNTNFRNTGFDNKNKTLMVLGGAAALGAIVVTAGILSKSSFEKNIIKKGLEFKDNILINKKTGEKFTGKIKSNIGSIGFNKRESQNFENGIIKEKTYRNLLGWEKKGHFYIDGKERLTISIGYPFGIPWHKHTSIYWRAKESGFTHIDGYCKGSAFEWARNFVKKRMV